MLMWVFSTCMTIPKSVLPWPAASEDAIVFWIPLAIFIAQAIAGVVSSWPGSGTISRENDLARMFHDDSLASQIDDDTMLFFRLLLANQSGSKLRHNIPPDTISESRNSGNLRLTG